ncbi:hypothetical protein EKD16_14490 [Streptomonospora litoralis]|uniref:Uncharacterized protein n=1 Tax=Streptomonospora litoralis TaxID=2498135 RepID=A0A4P6Q6J9_9ACTN|nr:hypothetical protein EKD16_14490 [Streptomonospora litoralis]
MEPRLGPSIANLWSQEGVFRGHKFAIIAGWTGIGDLPAPVRRLGAAVVRPGPPRQEAARRGAVTGARTARRCAGSGPGGGLCPFCGRPRQAPWSRDARKVDVEAFSRHSVRLVCHRRRGAGADPPGTRALVGKTPLIISYRGIAGRGKHFGATPRPIPPHLRASRDPHPAARRPPTAPRRALADNRAAPPAQTTAAGAGDHRPTIPGPAPACVLAAPVGCPTGEHPTRWAQARPFAVLAAAFLQDHPSPGRPTRPHSRPEPPGAPPASTPPGNRGPSPRCRRRCPRRPPPPASTRTDARGPDHPRPSPPFSVRSPIHPADQHGRTADRLS